MAEPVRKALQRRVYSLLSSRRAMLFCIIGILFTLNSSFRFAEGLLAWSESANLLSVRPFRDNIGETDFQERLCSPMPIDVVYTWVNGTDDRLQTKLAFYKALLAPPNMTDIDATLNATSTDSLSPTPGRVRRSDASQIDDEALRQILEDAGLTFQDEDDAGSPLEVVSDDTSDSSDSSSDDSSDSSSDDSPDTPTPTVEGSSSEESTPRPSRRSSGGRGSSLSTAPPTTNATEDHFSASRFKDNGELQYSLRSIEKFAPWIRNIYIVTNGQIPNWLNLDHPRLFIITHEQIFPNASHLPSFSSPAIESHLHRIPGLSERFIYLNDDVMFGAPVWPEDFYTQARGQKVYLTWPVPNCADGCPTSWIGDKHCDLACNTTACDFDGGDCLGPQPVRTSGRGSSFSYSGSARGSYSSKYCVVGCPDSWIGDRYCDRSCNVYECGFDAGDCGMGVIEADYPVANATASNQLEAVSVRSPAFYMTLNTTDFVANNTRISEVHFSNPTAVRTAVYHVRHNLLSVLLHRNISLSLTTVNLTLSSGEDNVGTYSVRLLTDTATLLPDSEDPDEHIAVSPIPEGETVDEVAARLGGAGDEVTWGRGRVAADVSAGSSSGGGSSGMGDIPAQGQTTGRSSGSRRQTPLAQAKRIFDTIGNNTYRMEENLPLLPDDVVAQFAVLLEEIKEDELTLKGFQRKSDALIAQYQPTEAPTDGPTEAPTGNSTEVPTGETASGARDPDSDELTRRFARQLRSIDMDEFDGDHIEYRRESSLNDAGESRWGEYRAALDKLTNSLTTTEADIEYIRRTISLVPRDVCNSRRLLDTFGDSLKHVNKLYNRRYGATARKVPAHMPHMINKEIVQALQDAFPVEFEETSANRLRNSTDMQYSFSYFYFMMQEANEFNATQYWYSIDTDHSDDFNANEMRTLAARLNKLPLQQSHIESLREIILNCSLTSSVATTRFGQDEPDRLTFELFKSCGPLLELIVEKAKPDLRYKFELASDKEVFFKMIRNNSTLVRNELDSLRKEPRKFVCLNDNIEHDKPGANEVVGALHEYYESMFPARSAFELPEGTYNEYLYADELAYALHGARTRHLMLVLGLLAVVFLMTSRCIWRRVQRMLGRSAARTRQSSKILTD